MSDSQTPPLPDDAAAGEGATSQDRRGWYWPFAIAGFLVCTATFDLCVMAIATNHPAIAIEEDYYEKGERWFEERAALRKSDELDWTVVVDSEPFRRSRTPLEITFDIQDPDGATVDLDRGIVSLFHVTRPRDVERTELRRRPDGRYSAIVPIVRGGLHKIRIEASRGGDRFIWSKQQLIRDAR